MANLAAVIADHRLAVSRGIWRNKFDAFKYSRQASNGPAKAGPHAYVNHDLGKVVSP